jgi:glycine/D-amino acid oxidase-like deaminating enzyme
LRSYDCAVLGAGVFGAWIAYRLRLSGRTVALVDPYGPANSRASSGGESRIIRSSYGADEIYSRWAWRSLASWKQLFDEVGQPHLFQPTGVLWTAPEAEPRVAENRQALARCGVPFEFLSHAEVGARWPQFHFNEAVAGIFEPQSGILLARRAVQAVVGEAIRRGVEWHSTADEVRADRTIYACGPWLPKIFPDLLRDRIRPTRQDVFFFSPAAGDRRFAAPSMPAWLHYGDPRVGYALPNIESRGFKLAFDRHGPEIDPDSMDRIVSPDAVTEARAFLGERFPALRDAPVVETRVCQYENTSNGDFLLDRHPERENVWIAGGGSGHGFKHGPAVGEYMEQLLSGTAEGEPRFSFASKSDARARSVY